MLQNTSSLLVGETLVKTFEPLHTIVNCLRELVSKPVDE